MSVRCTKGTNTMIINEYRNKRCTFCDPKLISVLRMESREGRDTVVLIAGLRISSVGCDRSYTCSLSLLAASLRRIVWPSTSIMLSLRSALSEASEKAGGTMISGALVCRIYLIGAKFVK